MGKLAKYLLLSLAVVVGIGVIAAVALYLFFDPNDFRDDISAGVKEATGRDLVIEGDISLSVFPWIAIDIGPTRMGNAAGFGDEAWLRFDSARLSVKLMPLLLSQDVRVGTAALDGFQLNLSVKENGTNNWDDLAAAGESAPDDGDDAASGPIETTIDVDSISLSDAEIAYSDAQAGSRLVVSGLSVTTGRIAPDQPFELDTEFDFASTPGDVGGHVSILGTITLAAGYEQLSVDGFNVSGDLRGIVDQPTEINFDARAIQVDTAAQSVTLGEMDLSVLGLNMSANVNAFSYAGTPQPTMSLRVNEFSLMDLMQTLGSEPPVTADPNALQRVSFNANAAVGETALVLSDMSLKMDDTTMTGMLSLPMTESGALQFDLVADRIDLDPYMAPASDAPEASADEAAANVEIPADMIRALNAKGSVKLNEAHMSGLTFQNMELGVTSAGGKLRMHPIAAELYEGAYSGDVRIDASGQVPSISVNENLSGVSLKPLAMSMFEQDNIAGTINGSFALSGTGADLNAIQRDLDGTMSFELVDGEWQGTDVWHELRAARAKFRGETPPEARMPARTEFTSVTASGVVTDGIFVSDDLLAELPFLRLTGNGSVNLPEANIDYSLQARVLDNPEFSENATAGELSDFTAAVIPLKISGPLASPSIRPDVEALVRQEVERAVDEKKEELTKRVTDRLFGSDEPSNEDGTDGEDTGEQPEDESTEDKVKDALKDLFKQ